MAKALFEKLADDINDHYNILIEDINAIKYGYVLLLNYPEMQNKNSKAHVEWREGASLTEQEHMSVSGTVLEDDINNLN
ncbi:hypothetical protein H5410_056709 [Solanum commersonii]|uniref:Uncharacterized protein n=1 Tax=Solanum commersonii TaxID=4109 RepID=A0A9J5WN10_SOLCO|nr:hypothetical protein H5410_056709 [Solanum commersonii]